MSIFTEQPNYTILDLGYNKSLTKALFDMQESYPTPELNNVFTSGVAPKTLISGELISSLEQQTGVVFTGKTAFDNTQTGYRLGIDSTDDLSKFYIGNTTNYLNWNGTSLTISGSLTVTTGTIGGFDIGSDYIRDAANSMGIVSTVTGGDDVRFWAGDTYANRAIAPFKITESGRLTISDLRIKGGSFDTPLGYATLAGNAYYSGGWKAIATGTAGYLHFPNDGVAAFQFYEDSNERITNGAISFNLVFSGYGVTGNPVNSLSVTNSITNSPVIISADGTDTDIDIIINPKGSGGVGIRGTAPNANAILDLQSTTQAFMPPRMTTTQRNAVSSPTAGMVVYNSTTNKLNVYTTSWEAVTSV